MTDRERLEELLYRAHHNASCVMGCSGNEEEAIEEEARYLLASGVTVQQWISVEDRLPEDGLVVQLGYANNKSVIAGYLYYESMEWYDYGDYPVARPTHWKALSEPPKEDTE